MLAQRLTAQFLAGSPAAGPVDAVARLLAVQGQDPRGLRLAVRARTRGLACTDVDRALTQDRSLVVTWLNRGTLHLVASDDYPWLHALTAARWSSGTLRRLHHEGVAAGMADRGVAIIEGALADEGPLTRLQLRDRLERAGVRTHGQIPIHLICLACLRGVALRGPVDHGSEQAYALVRDWLAPPPSRIDREKALAELARRYLAGHGPSDDRDLARWSGLPLGDARAGLGRIAPELIESGDGLLDLARRPAGAARLPPPRLLGAFDPVLLGWRARGLLLGLHEEAVVSGGIFRPFALVGGRAVATWGLSRGSVELRFFGPVSAADGAALEAEAADVLRFLGERCV